MKAGSSPGKDDKVPIRSEARPLPNPEPILGYAEREENGRQVEDRDAQRLLRRSSCTISRRPRAWCGPMRTCCLPDCTEVLANLQRHGIDVQELREDIDLDVEAYRVDEVGKLASRGWDRQDLLELKVTPRPEPRRVPAGTLLIKTAQPLGNLAVYLLEPRSEDGLAAWKFFDGLKAGSDFPVLRLPHPVPVATTAAEPLAEERKHDLPITFDMGRGVRGGGMASGFAAPIDVARRQVMAPGARRPAVQGRGRNRPVLALFRSRSAGQGVEEAADDR